MGILESILTWILDTINSIFSTIFFFLPEDPFTDITSLADIEFLQYLNYFIPVGKLVLITTVWLGAIMTFYGFQLLLRWIKAIGD